MVSGVDRCFVDGFTMSLQLSHLKKINLEAGFFSVPKPVMVASNITEESSSSPVFLCFYGDGGRSYSSASDSCGAYGGGSGGGGRCVFTPFRMSSCCAELHV